MYNSNLVACIKQNGQVLREFSDIVYIKYGSEYSILLKNLDVKNVVVNVYIDGTLMTDGGLYIKAGGELDLERSIKSGNLKEGNRFKFIERTSEIENHRGIKAEDGLVRIEYQFEKPRSMPSSYYNRNKDLFRPLNSIDAYGSTVDNIRHCKSPQSFSINNETTFQDSGITVPGSISNQSFTTITVGDLETTVHKMVFQLKGETNKKPVDTVKVDRTQKCSTCGRKNKFGSNFCSNCGTSLNVIG